MRTFEDLMVWQKAHQLVLDVYRVTEHFPVEERFGLTAQMRRAAISVPANIVEGHKRAGRREFNNFLSIAEGSLEELKYYALLAQDLAYGSKPHLEIVYRGAEEVGRMLHGLKTHVKEELRHAKTPSLVA
jgi:four helix bundle protein